VYCRGLLMTLAVNLLLLTVVLAPLRRWRPDGPHRPMRPGQRARWRLVRMSAEMITLSRAFNTMLDRIEAERRTALTVRSPPRRPSGADRRELHDEVGQTLTAVALRAERAAGELPAQSQALGEIVVHDSPQPRRCPPDRSRAAPEALDDLGLIDALISLCLRMERQAQCGAARARGRLPPLSPEVELVI